jgi:myo-inositol-1(or 4)-monophosphatase
MDRPTFASSTALEAGRLVLTMRDKNLEVGHKGDDLRDLVTNIDLAVDAFVRQKIQGAFPGETVYSEEDAGEKWGAEAYWSVDPIDGTANFARSIPHFATVISYVERGQVVAGAIYNPVTRELWHVEHSAGASLNTKPIRVNDTVRLEDAYVLLQIGRREETWDWGLRLKRAFLARAKKSLTLGSSALDLAFLASGRVDAVVYGAMTTTDIAGAIALVREAGGEVYDMDGHPVVLRDVPQQIIATASRALFDEMRAL